ncbi:MAG TPA: D-2-hydroxyacid dehydrogenase [Lachnoclostridium phytofermentans]|uniref:D-2-hydroxyacid dehydrogenase n=1 Tax=Lachnoclostridium phytofermentans TaxID=66219 RepID=A0A3D2X3L5_9FIRM|nr:D-2-hydroxyacid dehydrogenase [Lachnoclostridium sp.]HCL01739.1 D-2-hydroxyacid dehydrogenase [Lachnoclostridium phytofermentans]
MKIVIMEANTLGNDVDLSMFQEFGDVVIYGESNPLENAERIEDADVIIVNKIPMNEDILKGATKLKLICLTATGTNNIDFAYIKKHGISVANVKGYSTQSVVQHTFALLFYVYEKLAYYDHYVKSGEYTRSDIFSNFDVKFHELYGKTFGIIGLGEIGQGVARIAELFGCKVVYYSTSGKNQNFEYERVDLPTLLKISDVVSIHAPLTEATTDLIGEAELEMMKPDAILLNLGRGAIVNQEALANALLAEKIGGAGLDVLTVEPMLADNPLRKVQDSTRLIITPHIAWATVEARNRCAKEVYLNIKSYLAGEIRNIVE